MTEAYRIEEAARTKEAATAALYRPDGSPVYGEQEHRERVRSIRARHRAEFDSIEAEIEGHVKRTEERLLLAENADLASTLTTEELQRVSALSGFVADDVERFSAADLVKRCRAASLTEDRPTHFLLAHHASRRVGESLSLSDEEDAEEVREAVAQLRATLAPGQERKITAARAELEETQALREQAYYRRRGVRDATDLYTQGAYWTAS